MHKLICRNSYIILFCGEITFFLLIFLLKKDLWKLYNFILILQKNFIIRKIYFLKKIISEFHIYYKKSTSSSIMMKLFFKFKTFGIN